jgi:hypothetical protein
MISTRALAPVLTGLLLVTAACASTGGTEGTRTNYNVITHEEMHALTTAATLYDVVHQLRPRWLTVRVARNFDGAGDIVVYQDQTFLGPPDVLRQFSRDAVHTLRYLDGATASASLPGLGGRHVVGAIVLLTSPER